MAHKHIHIFDTTLGWEQVPGCRLNTDEKIEITLALEKLGHNGLFSILHR